MSTVQSLWHSGEIRMQQSAGVAGQMAALGPQVVREFMPDQHRAFFAQLPVLVLGSVDPAGHAWATLIAGRPGFIASPTPHRLVVDRELSPDDPATAGLADGSAVGLLGIELHTRRRNRMNGRIAVRDDRHFAVAVEHSFGNCPQYIQRRDARLEPAHRPGTIHRASRFDDRARSMIEAADTFFVASYADGTARGREVDVSHRGGKPGFVRIDDDTTLTIPDFAGNLHFNTLGNFLLQPRAGLVFTDFETGDMLQLTGRAAVILDSPDIAAFGGAERLWTFAVDAVVLRQAALPLRWTACADGISPNALMTGDWNQARTRIEAARLGDRWRRFRVAENVAESSVVRSLVLEPEAGGLIAHRAGQHLPIRVTLPGNDAPAMRTYTLSSAPSDGRYRISVKREGLVSTHLHALRAGDIIEARAPAGRFTIDALERRPAVLLAAGIGITPMLAMLRDIVHEGLRKRRIRRTWLFYAARQAEERAFDAELADLVGRSAGRVTLVRILSDPRSAPAQADHRGRLDIELLKATLPFDDFDFYLCGPPGFMQQLHDGLRATGVADSRIHAEAFGPASLARRPDRPAEAARGPAETPVPIVFAASSKEARWQPGDGSLLELAERRGLTPAFGCRSGSCGTCSTRVLSGNVAYPEPPGAPVADGEALICRAVPAADGAAPLILAL